MISRGPNTEPSHHQNVGRTVSLAELMGWPATNDIRLRVDHGVFPPHPDTVAMIEWCAAQDPFGRRSLPASGAALRESSDSELAGAQQTRAQRDTTPLAPRELRIVDLCTGTGFIAIALAVLCPDAQVVAVDSAAAAAECAARNAALVPARAGGPIEVRCGDSTRIDVVADLVGAADLVVANPPYLADDAQAPEDLSHVVAKTALFGGVDGLSVVRGVVRVAARLLKPGGVIALEHAAAQEQDVTQILADTAQFTAIRGHRDHCGTHRFLTARRG